MESGEGNNNEGLSSGRWTCEACGCNTNSSSDRSCSICGTSQGPSILRRAGYAARAGLFARGLGSRRDFLGDNGDMADLWGRVVEGVGIAGEDGDAMAALAMEVAGHPSLRSRETSRQRLIDAARTFSMSTSAGRDAAASNARELFQAASDNAANFRPRWMNPCQVGGRATTGNGIQVGDGERQNVAHLPVGSGEGRAVRSVESVPRNIPFSALVSSGRNQERRPRRTFGFRVAFDHNDRETGCSLGGCYLVGVTTSSFTNFGERNGLQQSPLFWGIEDGGNKFEGSRYSSHASRGSRSTTPNFATEIAPGEAPLNSQNVLFGAREVVTVVVDVDTRSLVFWRNDQLLGTLVRNLPQSNIYPIAVPFNVGATVAITGMDGNPISLLQDFNSGWRQAQQQKDDERRKYLARVRSILIKNGEPTAELRDLLRTIFTWYARRSSLHGGALQLDHVEAARLWCRCNMKLASLNSLLESGNSSKSQVLFDDFMQVISKVTRDDEARQPVSASDGNIQVGDRVELVEGYESKGDAHAGNLQAGDRGRVIELQQGPNGERHSVRVLHAGRRWWYQPQAVASERSGLIESPAVWWLKKILRTHGFDHSTLKSFVGKAVTKTSWEFGDIVVPKNVPIEHEDEHLYDFAMESIVGRIVPNSGRHKPSNSAGTTGNKPPTVLVEFVNDKFRELTKNSEDESEDTSSGLQARRVRVDELVHSTVFHGFAVFDKARTGLELPAEFITKERDTLVERAEGGALSEKTRKDISALAELNLQAIEKITDEIKRNPGSLASLFSAGLNDAIIAAIDRAEENATTVTPKQWLSPTIDALCSLSLCVAKQLFTEEENCTDKDGEKGDKRGSRACDDTMEDASSDPESRQNDSASVGREEHGDERGLNDDAQSGRLSTLQQRRSVLVALMSRARRNNAGSLNELVERENGSIALRQLMPGLGPFGNGAAGGPFFSVGSDMDDFFGLSSADNALSGETLPRGEHSEDSDTTDDSFLWSILQGSRSKNTPGRDPTGVSRLGLVKCLLHGLVSNSITWVKAAMAALGKIASITDEDNMPILQVAISVGCTVPIIELLVQGGAPISDKEVCKAAYTNQPGTLTTLLQHATYRHGLIELKRCSPEIGAVVQEACILQTRLEQKMRDQAGEFIAVALRRFINFSLTSRVRCHQSAHACSEMLTGVLAGHALLRALQQSQQSVSPAAPQPELSEDEELPSTSLSSQGLIKIVPVEHLAAALLCDTSCFTKLLLLIEDYLYSKTLADGAVGLTLLSELLDKFSFLRESTEMQRYGFEELVNAHGRMAAKRLAEVSNQKLPKRTSAENGEPTKSSYGSILCPAKHVAVLHITRHSSFRCDMCGKGVERGKPMHGCRECDWDACSACTDHRTAYIKNTHLKKLSDACQEKLSSCDTRSAGALDDNVVDQFLQKLSRLDNTSDLRSLSICLQQRHDGEPMQEIARRLAEPGHITTHQFSKIILPSLHASLLGRASESERASSHWNGSCHRNKKARVVDQSGRAASDVAKCLLNDWNASTNVRVASPDSSSNSEAADTSSMDRDTTPEGGDTAKTSTSPVGDNTDTPDIDIVRRLQKVLSFYETVSAVPAAGNGSVSRGALKSLTQPIDIQLWPSTFENQANTLRPIATPMKIRCEPLIAMDEIELQILRTCVVNQPSYKKFCQRLVSDGAIIVEQARCEKKARKWRLGRVTSFDNSLGCHSILYAKPWKKGPGSAGETLLEVSAADDDAFKNLRFEGTETRLILAARDYYILGQSNLQNEADAEASASAFDMERLLSSDIEDDALDNRPSPDVSFRVEVKNAPDDRKNSTVLACDLRTGQCVLVSDSGEISVCSKTQIVVSSDGSRNSSERQSLNRARQDRDPFSRGFPFLSARSHLSELSRRENEHSQATGVIRRTFSCLSLRESMRPIELNSRDEPNDVQYKFVPGRGLLLRCEQGVLAVDQASIQVPPLLRVEFSSVDTLPTVNMQPKQGLPLIGVLKQLKRISGDQGSINSGAHNLYFSVKTDNRQFSLGRTISNASALGWGQSILPQSKSVQYVTTNGSSVEPQHDHQYWNSEGASPDSPDRSWVVQGNRSRKLSVNAFGGDEEQYGGLCEGLDETCVQCMEVLGVLSAVSEEPNVSVDKTSADSFVNAVLSTKLIQELDDPLTVVGGALPDWCVIAPMFAPRLFSYNSRRLLLERSAFGVSRSTLKQQEAKVNVGRLRARMASLRGRAVELVGEAFSGGAEDPTALQLQADELYGMEESLANRVKAAFRAEQWEEHALEVAKAAIERERLLSDAERVLEKICLEGISGRRLEVRFENESGFDAAAGDEAGVTRGFYADVAEALMSCDHVAGVHCPQICSPSQSNSFFKEGDDIMKANVAHGHCKLPIFIPDTDSNSQVIIPTPRSDPRSGPGVYPRPLSPLHPQFGKTLKRYRFIGRLFATAMRDGFMFPLPLSASFLKLVQHCATIDLEAVCRRFDTRERKSVFAAGNDSARSNFEDGDEIMTEKGTRLNQAAVLTDADLPRPGFLGGEVHAVDLHVCRALDKIDAADPPLTEQELVSRYNEIATDKSFARVALGKSYDCSFEEYFQDKTFVDPLDPTQGPEATPLCPNGHERQVSIVNIREWVVLAKQFILHDGVIIQAHSFRSGVDDFFSAEYLRLFTAEELQRDVCGLGDNVDNWTESDIRQLLKLDGGKGAAEALVAVAAIGGEGGASLSRRFSASSPTIGFLVKALLEASPKLRRQFLSFVTSVPIVTPGKIEVVPVVSPTGEFQPMRDPGCLPRANTCARRLYLPKFESYQSFAQLLWAVVKEESKFKGFYEWRGS